MADISNLTSLISSHGLLLLLPLGIIEGPIVTVAAGWLARLGLMAPYAAFAVLVIADLIGDSLLYSIGSHGVSRLPARIRRWIGLTDDRLGRVEAHFQTAGPSTLVFGKLTHSAGAAILVAAGSARMPFGRFLWWNLLATLPKSAVLFGVGWVFGQALSGIDATLSAASAVALIVLALGFLVWGRSRMVPAE